MQGNPLLYSETFLNILPLAQHKYGLFFQQHGIAGHRCAGFSLLPNGQQVQIVLFANVQAAYRFSIPFGGNGNIVNGVFAVQGDIVQHMIRGVEKR